MRDLMLPAANNETAEAEQLRIVSEWSSRLFMHGSVVNLAQRTCKAYTGSMPQDVLKSQLCSLRLNLQI